MAKTSIEKGGMEQENRRGRPRKESDPQGTAALFLEDNTVNPLIANTYGDAGGYEARGDNTGPGTVLGGDGGFSLEDRLKGCADLARTADSETVRLQAMIKYSELERQLRVERGEGDIPTELAAFLRLVKEETPGECNRSV